MATIDEMLDDMFPETVFAKQYVAQKGLPKAITKQLGVVAGELLEVQDASSREAYQEVIEESVDAIHAVFTLLYMIPGYNNDTMIKVMEKTVEKNRDRGYYGD